VSPPVWIAAAAGGAVGAVARMAVSKAALRLLGPNFPWGTLFVNVAGSLAMGALIAWLAHREPQAETTRAFWAVGVLGAFTTFSTFALDALVLWERKAHGAAAGYVVASVALSLVGVFAGWRIARGLV